MIGGPDDTTGIVVGISAGFTGAGAVSPGSRSVLGGSSKLMLVGLLGGGGNGLAWAWLTSSEGAAPKGALGVGTAGGTKAGLGGSGGGGAIGLGTSITGVAGAMGSEKFGAGAAGGTGGVIGTLTGNGGGGTGAESGGNGGGGAGAGVGALMGNEPPRLLATGGVTAVGLSGHGVTGLI